MPNSNLPNGLTVMGVPTFGTGGSPAPYSGVPNGSYPIPVSNGNYWFVDSVTGSDGNAGTASSPLATIKQALSLCTVANNGDVIVLCPGHAETISTAAGVTIGTAGVTVVGLGNGRDRPVFTFATSTAATWTITAANVTVANIVAVCNIASLVSGFVVSAADANLSIEWQDTSSTVAALRAVLTTAGASRLRLNLLFNGFSANTVNVNAVRLVGGTGAQVNVNYYGAVSAAVVEFSTTAVVDAQITGWFYSSGTTNYSKNVVDTITGSTWTVQGFDGAAGNSFDGGSGKAVTGSDTSVVIANQAVPTTNSTANVLERDVIGSKADSAVTVAGTTASLAAYAKGTIDLIPNVSVTGAAVMTNGLSLFTIAGGPVQIIALFSICATANGATASTLQYSSSGTLGSTTQTISGASASLASAGAGTTVIWQGTALSTAPLVNANAANICGTELQIVPVGSITAVIGTGSTTGTWAHTLVYRPLAVGATVTNAF